jgi:hypothetical protein
MHLPSWQILHLLYMWDDSMFSVSTEVLFNDVQVEERNVEKQLRSFS